MLDRGMILLVVQIIFMSSINNRSFGAMNSVHSHM